MNLEELQTESGNTNQAIDTEIEQVLDNEKAITNDQRFRLRKTVNNCEEIFIARRVEKLCSSNQNVQ